VKSGDGEDGGLAAQAEEVESPGMMEVGLLQKTATGARFF
jgi:hypothetical protein